MFNSRKSNAYVAPAKIRPEILPYKKGTLAKLMDLKTLKYNGLYVYVVSFEEESERYVVRFEITGKHIKVKPNKLSLNVTHEGTYEDSRMSRFYMNELHKKPSIDFLRNMRPKMLQMRSLNTDTFVMMCDFWSEAMIRYSDSVVHREIINHMEDCIEMVDDPCGKLKLTRMIAKAECYENNMKRVIELLEPWVDCHYGYLPSICTTLLDAYWDTDDRTNDTIRIYMKAIDIIDRQLYNPQCNIPSMYATHVQHIVVPAVAESDKRLTNNTRKDLIKIIGDVLKRFHYSVENGSTPESETKDAVALARGYVKFLQRKYKECIPYLERCIADHTRTYGVANSVIKSALILRFKCFYYLGDKKNAKYSLKKLRKYGAKKDEIQDVERMFKKMNGNTKGKKAKRMRPCHKCANPFCFKVETKTQKFKICQRCKLVSYCSQDCQRAHWKGGHKAKCGTRETEI